MKEISNGLYQKCIRNFYYKNTVIKEPTNHDRVKACVFEGMIAGYNILAEDSLDKKLAEVEPNAEKRRQMVKDAVTKGRRCDIGAIASNVGELNQTQYGSLSRMSPEQFKNPSFNVLMSFKQLGAKSLSERNLPQLQSLRKTFLIQVNARTSSIPPFKIFICLVWKVSSVLVRVSMLNVAVGPRRTNHD